MLLYCDSFFFWKNYDRALLAYWAVSRELQSLQIAPPLYRTSTEEDDD